MLLGLVLAASFALAVGGCQSQGDVAVCVQPLTLAGVTQTVEAVVTVDGVVPPRLVSACVQDVCTVVELPGTQDVSISMFALALSTVNVTVLLSSTAHVFHLVPGLTLIDVTGDSNLLSGLASGATCVGDLNGDELPDVVVVTASGGVIVYETASTSTELEYTTATALYVGLTELTAASACALLDANADGALDLYVGVASTAGDSVFIRNGGPPRAVQGTSAPSLGVAASDFNQDGHTDVYITTPSSNPNVLLLANATAGFTATDMGVTDQSTQALPADINGDGTVDILVLTSSGALLFLNTAGDGPSGFTDGTTAFNLATRMTSVTLLASPSGDVIDLACVAPSGVLLATHLSPTSPYSYTTLLNGGVGSVAAADIDNDGFVDILVDGGVFFGGQGSFTRGHFSVYDTPPTSPTAALAFDGDGDGDVDVLSIPLQLHENRHTSGGGVTIRLTETSGAPATAGAIIRLQSNSSSQFRVVRHGGQATFAPPGAGGVNITAVFSNGVHQRLTLPSTPDTGVVTVRDLPFAVTATAAAGTGVVGVGQPVTVTVICSSPLGGLSPVAPTVNGVPAGSWGDLGDGVYSLSYTPQAGEPGWSFGQLLVEVAFQLPDGAVGQAVSLRAGGPGGDLQPPLVHLVGPTSPTSETTPNVTAVATEAIAAVHVREVVNAVQTRTWAIPGNRVSLGPYLHGDVVEVLVAGEDVAGNVGQEAVAEFAVDTVPPTPSFDATSTAAGLSSSSSLHASIVCDEPCTVATRLNGGAVVWLDANASTSVQDAAPTLDTVLLSAPPPVTASSNLSLSFGVVNATAAGVSVAVRVVSADGGVVVEDSLPASLPLQVSLSDGAYTVHAAATDGGAADLSPVSYAVVVDTEPPKVEFLVAEPRAPQDELVVSANEAVTFYWRCSVASDIGSTPWRNSTTGVLAVPSQPLTEYRAQVFGVDTAGNVGLQVVDTVWTAGECAQSVPTAGDVVVQSLGAATFWLSFTGDPGWEGGWSFAVDGGRWEPLPAGGVVLPHQAAGDHRVVVRPNAQAGCLPGGELPAAEYTVWAAQPPADFIEAAPPPSSARALASFELTPGLWTYEYRLDSDTLWSPTVASFTTGGLAVGLHRVEVRVVGQPSRVAEWQWTVTSPDSSSFVLEEAPDGAHVLEVFVVDEAGNVAEGLVRTWEVDTTPPTAAVTLVSPPFSASRVISVAVACNEPWCEFVWSSGTLGEGSSTNATLRLVAGHDGVHRVTVRSVDAAGLQSEPVSMSAVVDATPPIVYIGSGVPNVTASPAVTIPVTVNEDVEEVLVSVNGNVSAVPAPVGGAVEVVLPSESTPTAIMVAAKDLAGNVGLFSAAVMVLLDTVPPVVSSVQPQAEFVNTSAVRIGVAAGDTGSGVVHVQADVADAAGFVVTITADGAAEGVLVLETPPLVSGSYNVSVTAADGAGNVAAPLAATFVVDLAPPESAVSAGRGRFSTRHVPVHATSNEPGQVFVGFAGEGVWLPVASDGNATLVAPHDGVLLVEVFAVDAAGNYEEPPFEVAEVVVDTQPPAVALRQPFPPTVTADADLTACFNTSDANGVGLVVSEPGVDVVGDCVTATRVVDGDWTLTVVAEDSLGNSASPVVIAWRKDGEAPTTHLNTTLDTVCKAVSTTGAIVCGMEPPTATATCVDATSCVVMLALTQVSSQDASSCGRRLTGAPSPVSPGVPIPLAPAGDGTVTAVFYAVDAAGNVEEGNTTLAWVVDTVAPVVAPVLLAAPPSLTPSSSAVFQFDAAAPGDDSPGGVSLVAALGSGLAASVDGGVVQVDGLAAGQHVLRAWFVDFAGNDGPQTVTNWVVVDEVPGVEVSSRPAPVSGDATPVFEVAAIWSDGTPAAATIQVDVGAGFQDVCANTTGVCRHVVLLEATGPSTFSARAGIGGEFGTPATVTWEFKLCEGSQFAVLGDNQAISCEECPDGASCQGGTSGRDTIRAQPGYWAAPDSLRFYQCPVEDACQPATANSSAAVDCLEGYSDTLCAVCEDGFFLQFGLCQRCQGGPGPELIVPGVVLVGVLLVVLRHMLTKARRAKAMGLAAVLKEYSSEAKVVVTMVQIIASATAAYAIPWPTLFVDFATLFQSSLVDLMAVLRLSCAQPMTYYSSLVVTLVGFKVLLAVVMVVVYTYNKRRAQPATVPVVAAAPPVVAAPRAARAQRRSSVMQSMVAAAQTVQQTAGSCASGILRTGFVALFLAYPGVSLKIMKTFQCVEVEGDFWLVADMRLKCYDEEWFGYALYAVVMGCLYTAGLPIAITVILWRNRRRLGEDGVVAKWGFLYENYGKHAFLWEVVELLRKLWLTALVVLMDAGSPLQVTTAVLISGWAHVAHAMYKPWKGVGPRGTRVYVLQHGSLGVTAFVFLMGLLFKVEGVSQDGTTYNLLAWVMVVSCGVFLACAAGIVWHGFKSVAAAGIVWQGGKAAAAAAAAAARPAPPLKNWVFNPLNGPDTANTPTGGGGQRLGPPPGTVRHTSSAAMDTKSQPSSLSVGV